MNGETKDVVSGWTTDTLHVHLQRQISDMLRMLDERYATQVKAVDAAFAAQQAVLTSSLQAAERAVAVALLAAEKATLKAETAADKRFEAVNEFRSTLQDQQATFITRTEAFAAIDRNTERVTELTDRVNLSDGKGNGLQTGWQILVGAIATIGVIIAIYLSAKGG